MMTPQEVSTHSFAKATLGGYNLAQVDEFLDELTDDYTALYNENAILKNKLKVLSETVEEYRATEENMRKTLLAAQQMADSMVEDAKRKQAEMVGEAAESAHKRVAELEQAVAAEEYRLKKAQEATAAYVQKLAKLHDEELGFLAGLRDLVPPEVAAQDDPSADIEAAVAAQILSDGKEEQKDDAPAHPAGPRLVAVGPDDVPPMPDGPDPVDTDDYELDQEATRRFSDIQFGKDYKIE